jgi:hypothetical protein
VITFANDKHFGLSDIGQKGQERNIKADRKEDASPLFIAEFSDEFTSAVDNK